MVFRIAVRRTARRSALCRELLAVLSGYAGEQLCITGGRSAGRPKSNRYRDVQDSAASDVYGYEPVLYKYAARIGLICRIDTGNTLPYSIIVEDKERRKSIGGKIKRL